MLADKAHVHFTVEVVADDGAKRKEKHHDRDEMVHPGADLGGKHVLDEFDAGEP